MSLINYCTLRRLQVGVMVEERDTVSLGSLSSGEGCGESEGSEGDPEELELDTKQKHSLTIRVQKKVGRGRGCRTIWWESISDY